MKFTILGGQGYLGRHLADYLAQQGKQTWLPVRNDPDLFKADLGYVIDCAGITGDYIQRPFDTVEAHVCRVANFLRQARFQRFVYLSSTRLYDGSKQAVAYESDPLCLNPGDPRDVYALSKAMGESLCLTIAPEKCRIVRLSCVYGATHCSGFLVDLLKHLVPGQRLELNTSTQQQRDYVPISDIFPAIVQIAEKSDHVIYNLASGINISNAALFEMLKQATGSEVIPSDVNSNSAPPLINIDRAQQEFDFRPKQLNTILQTPDCWADYLPFAPGLLSRTNRQAI